MREVQCLIFGELNRLDIQETDLLHNLHCVLDSLIVLAVGQAHFSAWPDQEAGHIHSETALGLVVQNNATCHCLLGLVSRIPSVEEHLDRVVGFVVPHLGNIIIEGS